PRQLSGLGTRRLPHRHRRACRRHRQGAAQGRSLARRPHLLRRPGGGVRQAAADRARAQERPLQREALARAQRGSRRRAAGESHPFPRQDRESNAHRGGAAGAAPRDQGRGSLMTVPQFTGMKVFSTTLARDREAMGDNITRWLTENPNLEIVDKIVTQSSDKEFHCVTITLFYKDKPRTG